MVILKAKFSGNEYSILQLGYLLSILYGSIRIIVTDFRIELGCVYAMPHLSQEESGGVGLLKRKTQYRALVVGECKGTCIISNKNDRTNARCYTLSLSFTRKYS